MIGMLGGMSRLASMAARSGGQPGARKGPPVIICWLPVLIAYLAWHYWLAVVIGLPAAFIVLAAIGRRIRTRDGRGQANADAALRQIMSQYAARRPGGGR